jgi:hypothetical protein
VRVFDGVLVAVGLEAVGEWRVSLVVYVGMGVGLGLLEGEGGGGIVSGGGEVHCVLRAWCCRQATRQDVT